MEKTHEPLYENADLGSAIILKFSSKNKHRKITMVSAHSPSSGGIFIVFGFPRPTSTNQNLLQLEGHPLTAS